MAAEQHILTSVGAIGAFASGLVASGHCSLMCGPLACAAIGRAKPPPSTDNTGKVALTVVSPSGPSKSRLRRMWGWHAGRILAYVGCGALLGALGSRVQQVFMQTLQAFTPWLMAAGLVFVAFDLGRFETGPGIRVGRGVFGACGARLQTRRPALAAASLGALTPFLPCGVLYGLFMTALATGKIADGALVMGAFALGAVPAFVLLQLGAGQLTRLAERHPRLATLVRRGIPLLAAMFLVWRAVQSQLGPDDSPPACH